MNQIKAFDYSVVADIVFHTILMGYVGPIAMEGRDSLSSYLIFGGVGFAAGLFETIERDMNYLGPNNPAQKPHWGVWWTKPISMAYEMYASRR